MRTADDHANGTTYRPQWAASPVALASRAAASAFAEAVPTSTLDSMTSAVFVLSADHRIEVANTAAAHLLQIPQDRLVGVTLEALAGGDSALADTAQHLLLLIRERVQHGQRHHDPDFHLTTLEGRGLPVELRVTPVSHDQRVVGTLVVLQDITERKLAEQALRDGEERFRAIFNAAAIGMMRLDPTGRINETNLAFQALAGTTADHLHGRSLHSLVTDEHVAASRELFHDLVAGRRDRYQVELPIRHADGHAAWCQLTMSLLRDRTGWPLYAIGAVQDLSERRQLEAELARATKLEAIGQMAAGVAHEINTPIQFIGDNVRFLSDSLTTLLDIVVDAQTGREGRDDQEPSATGPRPTPVVDLEFLVREAPAAVEQTLEGVERVASIVKAMKALGHHPDSEHAPADLNQAILDALTVARNEIKYVADVDTDLGELPPVVCDVGEISQTLLNLFVNAAHAIADVVGSSDDRGRLTVRSRVDGDHVAIDVSDTGGGIPPHIRAQVFDPFFTTKEVGRGSGQGLALARAIVCDKHAGQLSFDSHVGRGTTFRMRLPVTGRPRQREGLR